MVGRPANLSSAELFVGGFVYPLVQCLAALGEQVFLEHLLDMDQRAPARATAPLLKGRKGKRIKRFGRHRVSFLKNHPEIGEPGGSHTRRRVFQRYPYTVVYRLKGEILEIIAIAHHSRHPEYWAGR